MFRPLRSPLGIVTCLLLLPAALARAQTSTPASQPRLPTSLPADQVEFLPAITFAQPGGETLNLDLARPKVGAGPRPAVVCIYGGGWISGSRSGMQPFLRYLAAYGYVAVAPTYRLAPRYPFPAAVADVRQCVRWLRRHAALYGVDPNRIGAMGLSAGGHLACLLGVTTNDDRFGPDDDPGDGTSSRVQAVVNYFGPADLASADWSALAVRKYLIPFLGGTAAERPEEYKRASPITYISRDDAPVLTFQGDKDMTVPPTQSLALHRKLDAAGVMNRLVILEGQDHGLREPHRSRTLEQTVAFFNETLRAPQAETRPGPASQPATMPAR